jgi:hypothetical protein
MARDVMQHIMTRNVNVILGVMTMTMIRETVAPQPQALWLKAWLLLLWRLLTQALRKGANAVPPRLGTPLLL